MPLQAMLSKVRLLPAIFIMASFFCSCDNQNLDDGSNRYPQLMGNWLVEKSDFCFIEREEDDKFGYIFTPIMTFHEGDLLDSMDDFQVWFNETKDRTYLIYSIWEKGNGISKKHYYLRRYDHCNKWNNDIEFPSYLADDSSDIVWNEHLPVDDDFSNFEKGWDCVFVRKGGNIAEINPGDNVSIKETLRKLPDSYPYYEYEFFVNGEETLYDSWDGLRGVKSLTLFDITKNSFKMNKYDHFVNYCKKK